MITRKFKALGALLAFSLASVSTYAVDLSTTVTNGHTNAVTSIDQHVSGSINSTSFEHHQNRGGAVLDANNSCTGVTCGTGNDALNVGLTVTATASNTVLDQLTTGSRTQDLVNCDVSVSVGGLTNSQGTRTATVNLDTMQQNNNHTTSVTGTVDLATITDQNYTGGSWGNSKLGNDVSVSIGGVNVSTEGDSVDVAALADALTNPDGFNVLVSGQDLNSADMNGLSVSWSTEALTIEDLSTTTTTGTTTSSTIYESLN